MPDKEWRTQDGCGVIKYFFFYFLPKKTDKEWRTQDGCGVINYCFFLVQKQNLDPMLQGCKGHRVYMLRVLFFDFERKRRPHRKITEN